MIGRDEGQGVAMGHRYDVTGPMRGSGPRYGESTVVVEPIVAAHCRYWRVRSLHRVLTHG